MFLLAGHVGRFYVFRMLEYSIKKIYRLPNGGIDNYGIL